MYTTCLWCNASLGTNARLPGFPVGRRFAFDAPRGRLWVICPHCDRWNLTPLDERWEAIEACERLFRDTRLRYSTDRIGLAQLGDGVDLVRVGDALRPEFAAWRYGRLLARLARPAAGAVVRAAAGAARALPAPASLAVSLRDAAQRVDELSRRWRLRVHAERVAHVCAAEEGDGFVSAVVRYRHLAQAELVRPNDRADPWRLDVPHDGGVLTLRGADGLRVAGKLLAALNTRWAPEEMLRHAVRKLEDAGEPDGYFHRVIALAMRTRWGRVDGPTPASVTPATTAEALALYITNRSFWGRGGIGSERRTPLARVGAVDRLALEMAANEDVERRALEGELAELDAAWREAEEIARIADALPALRAASRAFRPAFVGA